MQQSIILPVQGIFDWSVFHQQHSTNKVLNLKSYSLYLKKEHSTIDWILQKIFNKDLHFPFGETSTDWHPNELLPVRLWRCLIPLLSTRQTLSWGSFCPICPRDPETIKSYSSFVFLSSFFDSSSRVSSLLLSSELEKCPQAQALYRKNRNWSYFCLLLSDFSGIAVYFFAWILSKLFINFTI